MSILRFSGSTSALNFRIPFSRAAAARCSSRMEPMPRPLVRVGDVERDFGFLGVIEPVVAADAHDFPADGDHERHAVLVVHLGEAV